MLKKLYGDDHGDCVKDYINEISILSSWIMWLASIYIHSYSMVQNFHINDLGKGFRIYHSKVSYSNCYTLPAAAIYGP